MAEKERRPGTPSSLLLLKCLQNQSLFPSPTTRYILRDDLRFVSTLGFQVGQDYIP